MPFVTVTVLQGEGVPDGKLAELVNAGPADSVRAEGPEGGAVPEETRELDELKGNSVGTGNIDTEEKPVPDMVQVKRDVEIGPEMVVELLKGGNEEGLPLVMGEDPVEKAVPFDFVTVVVFRGVGKGAVPDDVIGTLVVDNMLDAVELGH